MARTGYKEPAAVLILSLFLLGLSSTAVAAKSGDLITGFDSPAENANITGSFDIKANTNASSNVSYVEFYYNRSDSGDWAMMANESWTTQDQESFSATNDTENFDDGPIKFNATAFNSTHRESETIDATLDDTAPNATDDLSVQGSLTSSPVAENLIDSTSITLDWSDAGNNELADATSGVEEYTVEYRRRGYNPPTQTFESWSDWQDWTTVSPDADTKELTELSDGYQYRFRLRVSDWAGHSNLSNTVNVTIDTSSPRFDTRDDDRISTPFEYTNSEDQNISANITDIAGIKDKVGDRGDPDTINLSVYNSSSRIFTPSINITPDIDTPVELKVETQEALEDLNHSDDYTVSLTATDMFSERTTGLNWTFTADFEEPEEVSYSASGIKSGGWYKDNVTFNVDCSDDVSNADAVSVEGSEWKSPDSDFTFDDSGSYTFRCRDNAGNINDSLSDSFDIDTGTPTFDSSDPEDDAEDVPTSFEFFASFGDESDESGIDTDESSLSLEGGDGSIENVEWDDDSVTADVEELEVDEGYSIEGTIADEVGHTDSFTVDFDTASLSSSDLQITSLPEDSTVYRNGSTETSFDVENQGEVRQTGIEIDFNASPINSSLDQDSGFDLEAEGSETVTANISASTDLEPGVYEASVEASSDQGISATENIDIRVVEEGVVIEVPDHPVELEVVQGNLVSGMFEIRNVGEDIAEDMEFSLPVENMSTELEPSSLSLDSLETDKVSASLSASNSTVVGIYDTNFSVDHPDSTVEVPVEIKVQPSTNGTKEGIESDIEEIEQRVENRRAEMNQTRLTELQARISQAQTAIDQGDYATAASLRDTLNEEVEERGFIDKLPLLPLLSAFIVMVIGILAYMLLPVSEEEEEQSFSTGGEEGGVWSPLRPVRPSKVDQGYSYEDKSIGSRLESKLSSSMRSLKDKISSSGGSKDRDRDLKIDPRGAGRDRKSGGDREDDERDEFSYRYSDRN